MKRNNKMWSNHEDITLKKLYKAGSKDEEVAEILGRSMYAVRQRRYRKRHRVNAGEPQVKLQFKEPKKEAKYTRYMKPSTEVSILWGLVKFSKA